MFVKCMKTLVLLVAAAAAPACTLLPLDPEEEKTKTPVSSNYLCDEGRSFNAVFDPEGRKVSVMIEGENRLLYRARNTKNPAVFTNGILSLHARRDPEPTIWLERNRLAIYRNCHQDKGKK